MAERSRQRSRLAGAGPALSGAPTLAGIGKDFTRLILKPSSASRDIWTLARSLLPSFLLSLQHTITECLPAKHPHRPPSSLVPALNSQPPLAPRGWSARQVGIPALGPVNNASLPFLGAPATPEGHFTPGTQPLPLQEPTLLPPPSLALHTVGCLYFSENAH